MFTLVDLNIHHVPCTTSGPVRLIVVCSCSERTISSDVAGPISKFSVLLVIDVFIQQAAMSIRLSASPGLPNMPTTSRRWSATLLLVHLAKFPWAACTLSMERKIAMMISGRFHHVGILSRPSHGMMGMVQSTRIECFMLTTLRHFSCTSALSVE